MKSKAKQKSEYEAQIQAARVVIVVEVKGQWIVELRCATHQDAEAHIAKKLIKTGYVIPEMIMPPFSEMIDYKPIISYDLRDGFVRVWNVPIASDKLLDRVLANMEMQAKIVKMRGSKTGLETDKDALASVWRFLAFESKCCREMLKSNDNRAMDHIKSISESMTKHIKLLDSYKL